MSISLAAPQSESLAKCALNARVPPSMVIRPPAPPLLNPEPLASFQCTFHLGFRLSACPDLSASSRPHLLQSGIWPLQAWLWAPCLSPMPSNTDSVGFLFPFHKDEGTEQIKVMI